MQAQFDMERELSRELYMEVTNDNIDGHILFGVEGHDCRTTIVNGRVVYRDREPVDCDKEKIDAFVMQQAKELWGELNGRAY